MVSCLANCTHPLSCSLHFLSCSLQSVCPIADEVTTETQTRGHWSPA
jgi:hypothetical protein